MVLIVIGWGSGGGAPVGRRWRRARWAGESLGRPTGAAGAVVRSAFSLTAPPALPGSALARAAPAHELQPRSRMFGNKLDQAIHKRPVHEFTGTQVR